MAGWEIGRIPCEEAYVARARGSILVYSFAGSGGIGWRDECAVARRVDEVQPGDGAAGRQSSLGIQRGV